MNTQDRGAQLVRHLITFANITNHMIPTTIDSCSIRPLPICSAVDAPGTLTLGLFAEHTTYILARAGEGSNPKDQQQPKVRCPSRSARGEAAGRDGSKPAAQVDHVL